jgi:hypothetical protein
MYVDKHGLVRLPVVIGLGRIEAYQLACRGIQSQGTRADTFPALSPAVWWRRWAEMDASFRARGVLILFCSPSFKRNCLLFELTT